MGFEGRRVDDPWGDQRDGRWYVSPEETAEDLIAASARARYSYIVVLPTPVLAARSLLVIPAARSRRTSVIFLIGSFFLGTWSSSNDKRVCPLSIGVTVQNRSDYSGS